MAQIISALTPKEVIAHYNQNFVVPYMRENGFEFKEKTLEYHRSTKDFKQVVWHRCDKNNIRGEYIGFAMGYSILCPKFKKWYIKQYGKEPLGGDSVIGYKPLPVWEKWNGKYNPNFGVFGYDLVKKDITDQFTVIVENLRNVILPTLDYYKDFDAVIDNPNLNIGEAFDLPSHLRQIEHCLFLGDVDRAKKLADMLRNDRTVSESILASREAKLAAIFNLQ